MSLKFLGGLTALVMVVALVNTIGNAADEKKAAVKPDIFGLISDVNAETKVITVKTKVKKGEAPVEKKITYDDKTEIDYKTEEKMLKTGLAVAVWLAEGAEDKPATKIIVSEMKKKKKKTE